MRNKLSYYSVLLLVGLAVVSAVLFTMNPFNGGPASATPPGRSAATTSASSVPATSTPAGNGISSGLQPGGTFDGVHHHHSDGLPGDDGNTTTTTTANVYSQNE